MLGKGGGGLEIQGEGVGVSVGEVKSLIDSPWVRLPS